MCFGGAKKEAVPIFAFRHLQVPRARHRMVGDSEHTQMNFPFEVARLKILSYQNLFGN